MRKLERELERLSCTLKNKLQQSLGKEELEQWERNNEKQGDKSILNVRQEIRKFLRTGTPVVVPKEEPVEAENMNSDFEDTWLPSPSPPPCEPAPVKQESLLPSLSPTAHLGSTQKGGKVSMRSSVKRRQLITRNNSMKPKRARPSQAAATSRPRRIQIRKQRKITPAMCELCGLKCSSQCDVDKHMITHKLYDNSIDLAISTTHFICNLCPPSTLFPTRKLLSAHKREKHAEELNLNIFKCSECPETFMWKIFFAEHLLRKHPLKFAEQDDYDKLKIFKYDQCDYQSVLRSHLNRHNQTHETGPLICQYCSSSLKNAQSLKTHMKFQHPNKLQSKRKPYNVLVDEALARHRSRGSDKQFPCKNCDAIFPKKLQLRFHLESTHKDLFAYQCDMCNKSYLSAPSLQTHKIIKHLEKGKKVKCGWCGKVVAHKTYLWSHMRVCPKKREAKEGMGLAVYAVELT